MLVLAKDKKIEDLEKYGFEILLREEDINDDNVWNELAVLKMGGGFKYVIENDMTYNQLTIKPYGNMPCRVCLTWELDMVYQLIKDGMLETEEV